jgi:membrane associated rhomboid family serine protease
MRCHRYICPECMLDAAVGHQCVECVNAGSKGVRQPRTRSRGLWGPSAPVVTYVLIAINVLAFAAQTVSPRFEAEFVMWSPGVANGELYRLLTSAFLHTGITHILFNMFALFVVGPPLENWLGRLRFAALYLLSALGGSVLIYLFSPLNVPTLGASGAVFGLFAATFVVARKVNVDIRWVVIMIVINLVITFTVPSISWQGHVGGLVTGGLVAFAYAYAPAKNHNQLQLAATVALVALFAALIWWRTSYLLALA